jgi:hypothetical protein
MRARGGVINSEDVSGIVAVITTLSGVATSKTKQTVNLFIPALNAKLAIELLSENFSELNLVGSMSISPAFTTNGVIPVPKICEFSLGHLSTGASFPRDCKIEK